MNALRGYSFKGPGNLNLHWCALLGVVSGWSDYSESVLSSETNKHMSNSYYACSIKLLLCDLNPAYSNLIEGLLD